MKIGIINVTGYSGCELARILYRHPEVEITCVTGRSAAGQKLAEVFPHLSALDLTIAPELEGSLEALQKQPDDRPVYRQMGPLLLEVEDRVELISELSTSIEKLQEHQQRLEEREQQLRDQYGQVVEQFEGSA